MTGNPEVTVVMIFFNADEFIREAIESVLAQSYTDWELILVDDGSTDRSRGIAEEYARKCPAKVRVVEHANGENRGMSASRNLGVEEGRGEYIAFLDADDVWEREKLREQVEILKREPEAAMVYGATEYWFSWSGREEDRHRDYVAHLGLRPDTLMRPPQLLTLLLESKAPTPCPSDILLRRETIERAKGFEEQFRGIYSMFEDQAFLSKVYIQSPVFVTNKRWFKYRQHASSCCFVVSKAQQKFEAGLFFFDWLEKYLREQGEADPRLLQALKGKRWRYKHPSLHRWSESARLFLRQTGQILRAKA